MNFLLKLFYTITGGRPMKFESSAFTDIVSGESVYYYRDGFGRKWMANPGLSLFRARARE